MITNSDSREDRVCWWL